MSAASIQRLVAAVRQAHVELHAASDRVPKLREFDLFGFRSNCTIAREELLAHVKLLDEDTLALLAGESWRCFHCDDVFTRRDEALEHFGAWELSEPACKLARHEQTLVGYIRELEGQLARWQADMHPLQLALSAMRAEAVEKVQRAEDAGYRHALEDLRKLGVDVAAVTR